jgi:hypothetical protein
MAAHKFRVGQKVALVRGRVAGPADPSKFEIVRTLPESGGNNQYRVRSLADGHERVVMEPELA